VSGPYIYNATVQRVIDGDTVVLNVDLGFNTWVNAQTFRLVGMNAREKSMAGGKEAAAHLSELLPHGTAVLVRSVKNDKYGGRYDAMIELSDGRDLSDLLIASGYGAAWDGKGPKPVPAFPYPGPL
jgi:endonuclease YncB( thermonuclease family)